MHLTLESRLSVIGFRDHEMVRPVPCSWSLRSSAMRPSLGAAKSMLKRERERGV